MNHAKTGKDCKASYLFLGSSTLKTTMAKSMYCIACRERNYQNDETKKHINKTWCVLGHMQPQTWHVPNVGMARKFT